jgi:tetratricopeptide (TPR) repeat protein
MRRRNFLQKVFIATLLIASVPFAHAQVGPGVCGDPFRNHFGPFDYRQATAETKELVERAHFTPAVESLQAGNTSMGPSGDLEYTLNVFPNHHRALMSLTKYAVREKSSRPGRVKLSIDCRFDRAERFRPDDAMVKVIHGLYLLQTGKSADAVEKLEQARGLDASNANVHYNLGLAYVELKQYDKAVESAHIAYAAGFPLPGLRDKLRRLGKWRDFEQGG